jgi:hypothetical protein
VSPQGDSFFVGHRAPRPHSSQTARRVLRGGAREEIRMFAFQDLFQWERFITPSIIKIFYWLAVILSALFGLSGLVSALAMLPSSPFGALVMIIASLLMAVVGIIFARISAEFILIVFRINEHLGAIRNRGEMQ